MQPFLTYMLILIPLLQVFSTTFCTTVQKMRIKTYLRSTMSEQRLNDLAVLSIERDFSSQLSHWNEWLTNLLILIKIEGSSFHELCPCLCFLFTALSYWNLMLKVLSRYPPLVHKRTRSHLRLEMLREHFLDMACKEISSQPLCA